MATRRPEADRICNLKPTPPESARKDWRIEHALASNAVQAPAALPPSLDLREAWWDIGDQDRTGSCVGWACADGVARYHMTRAGRIAKPGRMSVRQVWMASKETDEIVYRPETFVEEAGTTLKAAMDVVRKYGVVPESVLPFHVETSMYLGNEDVFYATAATRRVGAYFNLGKDVDAWRSWLATQGPILAGLKVDSAWDNAAATHGRVDVFHADTVRGGHAVCIVGYTDDRHFIVRNSWGTKWGDDGFGYASEAYIKAGFFNESYGVTL